MAPAGSQTDLRLVVLGRADSGQSSAVRSILGSQDDPEGPKCRGQAAGRQVSVITSADWFSSTCVSEDRRRHISSFVSLSSPGPHAFLLCVPINQPSDGESRALDALETLFGPSALSTHTVVLFTRTEELEDGETLGGYLVTWRKDLLELVERCGDRYHTLETRNGEAEERKAVEELLEKVEQAVKESETERVSCPLYQQAEERVRERQMEIVRQRRPDGEESPTEDELESVREEAEGSAGQLEIDVDHVFPPAEVSPSSGPPPGFLWGLWEKLLSWVKWLPRMVRREALLGALVGMFVGGPVGGMVGASVGSVATEVGRRKTQKNK